MPNKIKVTKQDILNDCLNIVKTDGEDAVNARRIAKDLNCSTQPVYYHFPTMDILRSEIKHSIRVLYNQYIEEAKKEMTEYTFRAVGIAYIRFASQEPNFFKALFMDNEHHTHGISASIDDNYDYVLSTIVDNYHVSLEQARTIYENVWVTTHGLAVMIATGFMKFSQDKIMEVLTSTVKGQLLLIKSSK